MSTSNARTTDAQVQVVELPARPAALRQALREALADDDVEALALTRNIDLDSLELDDATDTEQVVGKIASQLGAPRARRSTGDYIRAGVRRASALTKS